MRKPKPVTEDQRVKMAVEIIEEERRRNPNEKWITKLKEKFDRSFDA